MQIQTIFCLSALALVSACAGPNVKAPATPSTIAAPVAAWSADGDIRDGNVKIDWWTSIGDPDLDRLVERALANNADIRAATANLSASEALLREARAARLPSGGISGGIERNRTPAAALQLDTVGGPSVLPSQTLVDIGSDLSWELDLGGRIAATRQAASVDRVKAQWAIRSAQASVVAGVVRAWFELGIAREQVALIEQRIAGLRSAVTGLNKAVALGGVRVDQRDAMLGALRGLDAVIPGLRASERNAARRIATLTGAPAPTGVRTAQTFRPAQMPIPQYINAPSPAELLRLRPDVAMAEQDLLKATAGIGIARSELYPRISFGANLGLTATPNDVGRTGAFRFGIGPSVSWGLFDMGRIRARIRSAGAQADAAAATWESQFLKAIEETDASLDQLAASREAWTVALEVQRVAEQELGRSATRFAQGLDSRVAHLQLSDRTLSVKLRETEARAAALLAWVNVQIAFGAGWRMEG